MGDEIESRVIDRTFAITGLRERELFVSSTKGIFNRSLLERVRLKLPLLQALVDQEWKLPPHSEFGRLLDEIELSTR
jgi:hypothetical protein